MGISWRVLTGDELVQSARVRIFHENDEMLEQVEEPLALEHSALQILQLQRRLRCIAFDIDGAPDLKPFLVRCLGTDACLQAMAHH
jgi:hypothetical protein